MKMKRIVVYVMLDAYVDENVSVNDIREKIQDKAEDRFSDGFYINHNDDDIEFRFYDDVFIGTSAQLMIGGE